MKKEKFIHIPAEGMPEVVELDADNLRQEIYKTIGCKVFELAGTCTYFVAPPEAGIKHRPLLILDEEGRICGKDLNVLATWAHSADCEIVAEDDESGSCSGYVKLPRHTCEWIVGDCLLANEVMRDGEPDIGGLTDDEIIYYMCSYTFTGWERDMAYVVDRNPDDGKESADHE